jgi:enterochelin esterase-like enzyme
MLTRWLIAYPPGSSAGARLPVCVVLHGRGDDAAATESLGYPQFLAATVRAGGPRFALAAVDGGDRYWHARAAGDDSGAMVVSEFLPMLASRGLAAAATDRIAFLGWSMGGYGSLLLASHLGRTRVAAVVAESPALWRRPEDTAAGAFDDPADYRRNDVFSRRDRLAGIAIKIDCGVADPFYRAARAFASGLPGHPVTGFGDGDHTGGYWRAKAPKSIAFIGNALVR